MEAPRIGRLTVAEEGYIEAIYTLIQEQGYARVADIAATLNVKPPSVTNMIKKLDEQKFVNYTRYRGVVLTSKGRELAGALEKRHQALKRFLAMIGVSEAKAEQDACELEHRMDRETVERLTEFVEFMQSAHPTSTTIKKLRPTKRTGKRSQH
jgi:DtxR family Mn-dependent transcriptional regulator